MVLPFVRDLYADAEKLPAFLRVTSHLRANAGRIRVAGLSSPGKALLVAELQKVLARPLILLVRNNEAVDDFLPVIQAFSEIVGGVSGETIVSLPARDVLPFQTLSPHPEIQEQRAIALWKVATGAASIVIVPAAASAARLRPAEFYADLARVVRRGEAIETGALLEHLNSVGYNSTDVVEMPGEYALRGGILDVYSPEAERPVRVEFFGDEVESIRKFDPATQRSSTPANEAVLLPLSETPVNEQVLGAIHARLSGKRISGPEEILEQVVRAGGVTVFPGWEFYAPVAGTSGTIFELLPNAAVLADEPELLNNEFDQFWEKVEEAHERSGVGNLVRPTDLYLSPEEWKNKLATLPGADVEHLGVVGSSEIETLEFHSQPSPRFHGSIPIVLEEVKKHIAENRRVLIAAPNTGELERLADFFTEYGVSFRLGSRTRGGESYADETAYFAGEVLTTTLVKAYVPDGMILPDAGLAIFGTRDLFDESESVVSRPQRQRSKTSAFLSDFRDLQIGDYVVHVEHGIGQYA
jgi:transcription-repair coupling factor (superfamily II helicase)